MSLSKTEQAEIKINKVLNTQNLVLGTLVIWGLWEVLSLKKRELGGPISTTISRGLKATGAIGLVAFGFLVGHWTDDADE